MIEVSLGWDGLLIHEDYRCYSCKWFLELFYSDEDCERRGKDVYDDTMAHRRNVLLVVALLVMRALFPFLHVYKIYYSYCLRPLLILAG